MIKRVGDQMTIFLKPGDRLIVAGDRRYGNTIQMRNPVILFEVGWDYDKGHAVAFAQELSADDAPMLVNEWNESEEIL